MATIIPFRAIKPTKDKVHMVVSRSVAVYSRRILNAKLETNPFSFLHVIKPEHFSSKKSKPASLELFKKVRGKFEEYCNEGILIQDKTPSFYIYRQIKPEGSYTGIIGGVSIDDYLDGNIKVHEQTLTKREKIFEKYLSVCDFNAEPVLLTYPDQQEVNSVVEKTTETIPYFDFSTTDRIRHQLWPIGDLPTIEKLQQSFTKINSIYIADGHHRSASSALLGKHKREQNPNFTGDEGYNSILAYLIPESQLAIHDFNRLVKDLNGNSVEQLLNKIADHFIIEPQDHLFKPTQLHEFSMYLDKKWYKLKLKPREVDETDPVATLDSAILTEFILDPIFDIKDLKTSSRISFLGGLNGMEGLQNEVDKNKAEIAFGLFPVSIEQLKLIADTHNIMPPKLLGLNLNLEAD